MLHMAKKASQLKNCTSPKRRICAGMWTTWWTISPAKLPRRFCSSRNRRRSSGGYSGVVKMVTRMLAMNTNAPMANATFTEGGTTPGPASFGIPIWVMNHGRLLATHVPTPMISVCSTKPYERCSSGSLSATSARNGSMLMLMLASSTHSRPAAIHNVGECGMNTRAMELRMAPIRKNGRRRPRRGCQVRSLR